MNTTLERLASALRDSVGNAVYRIQVRAYGTPSQLHMRSRRRWLTAEPDTDLTWGRSVTGDAFVRKVVKYASPTPETSILEIGPGYGRVLETWLRLGVPFKNYVGVDLSLTNVRTLAERFQDPRLTFTQGDIESVGISGRFDLVISSLVFKHLYPSFEETLRNVSKLTVPRAMVIFDIREGHTHLFDPRDHVSFIRWYTKAEVMAILDAVGVELVCFDRVDHDPEHRRLLVVARFP